MVMAVELGGWPCSAFGRWQREGCVGGQVVDKAQPFWKYAARLRGGACVGATSQTPIEGSK